jgi:hypothetical protein
MLLMIAGVNQSFFQTAATATATATAAAAAHIPFFLRGLLAAIYIYLGSD